MAALSNSNPNSNSHSHSDSTIGTGSPLRTIDRIRHVRFNEQMAADGRSNAKIVQGEFGYVLDDVPHLTDYLPNLPTYPNPLQNNPAYSVVKQYFVDADDTVPQKIVVQKDSPRGTHFRRAGPRQKVYFEPDDVQACIVTCGGLCPGLNTVIREIVCGLSHMYGVNQVFGIVEQLTKIRGIISSSLRQNTQAWTLPTSAADCSQLEPLPWITTRACPGS